MNEEKQYVTKAKLDEFIAELEDLRTNKRQEVAAQLEYARSLGDLSENAEYKEARELQSVVEGRIAELEFLISHAEIIKEARGDEVAVGSRVSIVKVGEKEQREYEIVGPAEANMKERKISHISPLGAAMLGKKKGQFFEFETPSGVVKYKIIALN